MYSGRSTCTYQGLVHTRTMATVHACPVAKVWYSALRALCLRLSDSPISQVQSLSGTPNCTHSAGGRVTPRLHSCSTNVFIEYCALHAFYWRLSDSSISQVQSNHSSMVLFSILHSAHSGGGRVTTRLHGRTAYSAFIFLFYREL